MKITDYRPDDSDEEIDVVVRYPAAMRTLAQLDRIRMETSQGLIPIGNFVEMTPEAKTGKIRRVEVQPSITVRARSVELTSELQSLMRISYAFFFFIS